MRTIIASIIVSGASLIAVSAAQAADAVEQIPEAPVAIEQPAPAANWSGYYLGATGNYDFAGKPRGGAGSDESDGFGGSLYTGYNWQSGQIVYGVEADVGYADQKSFAGGGVNMKEGWNGSVRGRVGYDLSPVLVYGTAGVAAANNKVSNAAGSDDKTAVGYTVGAGVETMVTDNITARVEYRYTDYQKKDFNIDGTTYSRGFDDNSVKVGIGMKF